MPEGEGPLLLTLDYPGYRREARISDLHLEQAGIRVREVLHHPLPHVADGPAYVAQLLADDRDIKGPATAVAAYCASAPLALTLASALRQAQPPVVILFDAWQPIPADILSSHRQALQDLGVTAERGPQAAAPTVLDQLVSHLVRDLQAEAFRALRALGTTEEEMADSVAHFTAAHTDWLFHLAAAQRGNSEAAPGEVVHLLSKEAPLARFRLPAGHRCVHIQCSRKDLLRAEQTRAAVLGALQPSNTSGR